LPIICKIYFCCKGDRESTSALAPFIQLYDLLVHRVDLLESLSDNSQVLVWKDRDNYQLNEDAQGEPEHGESLRKNEENEREGVKYSSKNRKKKM
jgi:hypothetical protein